MSDPATFSVRDLEKLMRNTRKELAELDRKRKEEFKNYQMSKEYKRREALLVRLSLVISFSVLKIIFSRD